MMPILTLLLAGFLTQQPQSTPRRPTDPATTNPRSAPASQARDPHATGLDSTTTAVTSVGQVVADVKAEADRFRTRAFNDPTAAVLESAAAFRASCERLTVVARTASRTICRHCIGGTGQAAFDHYREFMPSLGGLGGRCATRLRSKVTEDASPAAIRQTAIDMSNMIIAGLRPYERRVRELQAALTKPRPASRRGGD